MGCPLKARTLQSDKFLQFFTFYILSVLFLSLEYSQTIPSTKWSCNHIFFAEAGSALEQFDVLSFFSTPYAGILTNIVVFVIVVLSWAMAIFVSVGGDLLLADLKNLLVCTFVNFSKNLFKENLQIKTNIFFIFCFHCLLFYLLGTQWG